jgi:hypothetical protein
LSKIPPVAHRTPVDVFLSRSCCCFCRPTISFPNE